MIVLQEKDLQHVISSVIKKLIAEEMHVISGELFPLALFIYDEIDKKIRNGKNSIEFEIPAEEAARYYPYSNPKSLKIICGLGVTKEKMEYKRGTIKINVEYFYVDGKERCVSRIIHELTHFVNDNEGGIKGVMVPNDNTPITKTIKYLKYFLRETECNSRCSELGFLLQNQNSLKNIDEFENITHLKEIEKLLKEIENANTISKQELDKYKKSYLNYKKKILNVYYYFLSDKLSK